MHDFRAVQPIETTAKQTATAMCWRIPLPELLGGVLLWVYSFQIKRTMT